ncbi:MAG: lysine--tRNA ligase [bacterium]
MQDHKIQLSEFEQTERDIRIAKIEQLRQAGVHPYPERYDVTCQIGEIPIQSDLPNSETVNPRKDKQLRIAGRIVFWRSHGKLVFAHLQDITGRFQVAFMANHLDKQQFQLLEQLDLGDFIGVEGHLFATKKGEPTLLVTNWTFLGKALRPLPEKWHGLEDLEVRQRQRYLDLIANADSRARFLFRSQFMKTLREFYWQEGFIEVETPVLLHQATGANAKPYITHNNALDIDVVLRISHELPLKELIVGGFTKIFELGKAFRNEGHDPSHLPEHTHLEHYAAYWNFEDNIKFTEQMFDYLFMKLGLPKKLKIKSKDNVEQEIDFNTPWPRVDFVELVSKDSGLDILSYTGAEELRGDLRKKKIDIDGMDTMSLATLVDNVYKKVSRPKIINPTILYHYPKASQPLARVNDHDNRLVDQFQLVVNGWEIVKAYSELVDPLDQRQRFAEQIKAKQAGDEEAMETDEEYLSAMEYGLPPISGWGMGVERVMALLTGQENLREVVLFPLLKPKD